MAVFMIFCAIILYFKFIINILIIFRQPKIHFTCMWVWTSYKAWTILLGQSVGMQRYIVCWIRVWRIAWKVSSWVRLASTYTWWVMLLTAKLHYIPSFIFFTQEIWNRHFLRVLLQTTLMNYVNLLKSCTSLRSSLFWNVVLCGSVVSPQCFRTASPIFKGQTVQKSWYIMQS